MTYEKAIRVLQAVQSELYDCGLYRAIPLAIEALEKQIPKEAEIKPLYFENSKEPVDYLVHCPFCDRGVCFTTEYDVRENYKYCPACGQRIEWR